MARQKRYPKYQSYESLDIKPTVLYQNFHELEVAENLSFYPQNRVLNHLFTSKKENRIFGASSFCSFLGDTIEVEHNLVIPAISKIRRLPYKIPPKPLLDLYKTATDEGFHAEQSLAFLTSLEEKLNFIKAQSISPPLFLRRLGYEIEQEQNQKYKNLLPVINGIITETRISVELSQFATNKNLLPSVRSICKEHAADEAVHSSQFQALGRWLWDAFDESEKERVSNLLVKSMISRSLPDLHDIAQNFCTATRRPLQECENIVFKEYNPQKQVNIMLEAAKPTIQYLKKLGITEYLSIEEMVNAEQEKLLISNVKY